MFKHGRIQAPVVETFRELAAVEHTVTLARGIDRTITTPELSLEKQVVRKPDSWSLTESGSWIKVRQLI